MPTKTGQLSAEISKSSNCKEQDSCYILFNKFKPFKLSNKESVFHQLFLTIYLFDTSADVHR